jgi:NAD(P)-dependent dehydrogenase (short-subunit alcohol dehydrogenase family)
MNCIILGDRSDIAMALRPMLAEDGWNITGWNRWTQSSADPSWPRGGLVDFPRWNLILCAIGTVAPVGHWASQNADEWDASVDSNCLTPIRLVRTLWNRHEPDAAVCFLAGANPNKAGINYSGYYTGKMALLKAVENIDAETPDCKFFALAPGVVFTKIHQPTYDSGIVNPGLEEKKQLGSVPIEKIYTALKWCLEQPKSVVGGRNICVSDPLGHLLAHRLQANPSLFKLRRVE